MFPDDDLGLGTGSREDNVLGTGRRGLLPRASSSRLLLVSWRSGWSLLVTVVTGGHVCCCCCHDVHQEEDVTHADPRERS